ncbi:Fungal specific transcription factor domain-containing protein [Cladophialophora immunda]|nr:Fungal specific transcription factor domain-containing protein [Cladophialophora immunda]
MLPASTIAGADATLIAEANHFGFNGPLETHPFVEQLTDVHSGQWLLEDDFDFTIFENMGFSNTLHEPQYRHHDANLGSPHHHKTEKPKLRPAVLDLRQIWYIQVSGTENEPVPDSGTGTPREIATTSLDNIDEIYRVKMAKKLRPTLRDEPLPSIDFMNLCIHLFFTRFNVALPLIHSPTFRPTHSNALLVLSICSAGCLSLGSEMSAKTGSMLFERVNKAILVAPWERALPRATDQTWNLVKASMIGQTYALLSGDPAHRATAAAYHGSLIALARHHKLFTPAPPFHLPDDLSNEALDKAWRTWVTQEELRRVAVLLYIHDAEIAALFHHEPVFRHNAGHIPTVSSSELFCAPSASTWASLLRAEQRDRQFGTSNYRSEITGSFNVGQGGTGSESQSNPLLQRGLKYRNILNVYNGLSGISASICECRHLDLLSFSMVSKFESDLLTWYASTPKAFKMSHDPSLQTEAPFSLLPLWHYNFLTLSTDLNILEVAIGKEGSEVPPSVRESVLSWITSLDSKRCLLHALFLQNLIVSTNMGALVAIHTPRILFSAAICWYCYMLYLPESSSVSVSWAPSFPDRMFEPLNSLPEIQLLREGKNMDSTNIYPVPHILDETLTALPKILAANVAEMKANTLCVIECILRRLGTTGISLRFADIIQVFISGERDSLRVDQHAVRYATQVAAA